MTVIDRIALPRLLTPEQATEMVGATTPDPDPSRAMHWIDRPTIVRDVDTDEPVIAYLPLEDPGPLRRAVMQIDCSSGVQRQTNYRSRSRTFGFATRRPVTRRESCSVTALGVERPDLEAVLEGYTDQFAAALDSIDPSIIPADRETLGGVLPEWRMGASKLWTSGVVNDTTALPYHRDGFNFSTWSAMPVLRRTIRGGHLHLPEYGVHLECADATVTYFPGYRYLHGVTPLRRNRPKPGFHTRRESGYRISIVYYALRGMRNCLEAAQETALGRRTRTEREAAMAERLANGDTTIPGGKPGQEHRRVTTDWRSTGGLGNRDTGPVDVEGP